MSSNVDPGLEATEVFTPADFPTYTYINRSDEHLEQQLRDALKTPNVVVSLSGPSKSGKTALVKYVLTNERTIFVSGAEINAASDLWDRVLDYLDVPDTVANQSSDSSGDSDGTNVSAGVTVPGLFTANVGRSQTSSSNVGGSRTETRSRNSLKQIQDIIGDSDVVVFLDDFHYIDSTVQREVAKQIKAASERGITIIVASVPHRADDVVRTNAELRGRVRQIDTTYWSVPELEKIALVGFPLLNVDVEPDSARVLAIEACGSPQLMQQLCLQACFIANLRIKSAHKTTLKVDADFKQKVLEQSASMTDHSSLVTAMHAGPLERGRERSRFQFSDGTTGDVYRAVLLAIGKSPPILSLTYQEIIKRVEQICVRDSPTAQSVVQACIQMAKIAKENKSLEWDNNVLSIADPYLLFYLQASHKLKQLAKDAP
jgi:hypothetical protein